MVDIMVIYLMLGIVSGVWLGMLADRYFLPYLDILLDKFTYREAVVCTQYQLESQAIAKKFDKECGVSQVQELSPCVGFRVNEIIDEDEYDYDDKKIGFK